MVTVELRRYPVDARRVYATDMSNGGLMDCRLASDLSDRLAALAPVAGAVGTENIQPKRPRVRAALPRHADSVVKGGSLVVTVGTAVEGREKRRVKLIEAGM